MLQLCLQAKRGGKHLGEADISETGIEEIAAQCLEFFLIGSGSVAGALNFTTYALALYPEHQEEVVREIENVLKEVRTAQTVEDCFAVSPRSMIRMGYLRNFCK